MGKVRRLRPLLSIVADGFGGAAGKGGFGAGNFFRSDGLVPNMAEAGVIVAAEEGRGVFAAKVAVDAAIIDIIARLAARAFALRGWGAADGFAFVRSGAAGSRVPESTGCGNPGSPAGAATGMPDHPPDGRPLCADRTRGFCLACGGGKTLDKGPAGAA